MSITLSIFYLKISHVDTHPNKSVWLSLQHHLKIILVVYCLLILSISSYHSNKYANYLFPDPPTTEPVITSNSSDGYLYQGDRATLICAVVGGKPVAATTLHFTCPGKGDRADTVTQNDARSSLEFSSFSTGDRINECSCTASWTIQPSWYHARTITSNYELNSKWIYYLVRLLK